MGFGLLVRKNKQFGEVSMGSHYLLVFYRKINESMNKENNWEIVIIWLNSAYGMSLYSVGFHTVRHTLVDFVARLALSCDQSGLI